MIISRLRGGLGNQMFQYAAAMACARQAGLPAADIRFDLAWFRRHADRRFELDVFGIAPREAGRGVLALARLAARLPFLARAGLPAWRREAHFHHDPALADCCARARGRQPLYLTGYWQSPRYFAAIEAELRAAYRFRPDDDVRNRDLANRMQARPSVSVHVRRGDYATNPRAGARHGVLDAAYYRAAIALVADRVGAADWYVFTDTPGDAAVDCPGPTTWVTHNRGAASCRDLELMASCSHHVIANSSFSWWGAWLAGGTAGHDGRQVVVAPHAWFTADGPDTRDLLPPSWLRA
jgi:hypothetical protein